MPVDTKTFFVNIFSCLFVTVHDTSTNRAYIRAVRKLKFLMDMTTCKAGLAGWEPFADKKNQLSLPGSFIKQHVYEHAQPLSLADFPKCRDFFIAAMFRSSMVIKS